MCSFIQKGISVISTPIFTRIMSTEEYGKYSVFNSWESIISIFVTLNLFYGVYNQGLVKFEKDKRVLSSSMQGLTLTLVIIWTLIYFIFRSFFNNLFSLQTNYMVVMLLIIWLTAVFNFWASEQRVDYNYKALVIITILTSVLNPIIAIVLMKYINDKVLARVLGIAISYILFYTWMFFKQYHKGKRFFSKIYWKYALDFNIPLIPHYLSQTVLNSSDRIMIDRMINSSTSGIYSLAYSISLVMTLFNNALMQTMSPWIYKKIKDRKISEISTVAYSSMTFIAVINLLIIAFAPEIVKLFAPEEYFDAIWIVPPVAMSVYFMFSYDLFAKFEFYYEKTKMISVATFIGAVLNIIMNYVFIRKIGYIAAGYTTLICYILYSIFHYAFMRKICKKEFGKQPYDSRILLAITTAFICSGFLFLFLYKNNIVRYIVVALIIIIMLFNIRRIIGYVKRMINLKGKEKS